MSNLRLTIIMFILAMALAPALIIGLGSGSDASAEQRAPRTGAPPIDAEVFKPAGLNAAPWLGSIKDEPPAAKPDQAATPAGPAPKPITVVELFTSEGCSSCPPADRLLADLAREHASDLSVFLLAFHVDYWDYLGWKDPFASAAATARQRAYAKVFDEGKVYTPQMIVNGERGFVGSDRTKANEAITASRTRKAGDALAIGGSRGELKPGDPVEIECVVRGTAGAAKSIRLVACLVEDGLVSQVKRGENEGRELKHERVVRAMSQQDAGLGANVRLRLDVPKDAKPNHCAVVVLAQDAQAMRVLGAAEIGTKPKEE